MGKAIGQISKETLNALTSYSWPGNIRELQNLIERAVIRSDNGVLTNPLPPSDEKREVAIRTQATLKESERFLILKALQEAGWMIGGPNGAAMRLGLKRTTLIAKMKKFGISKPTSQNETHRLNSREDKQQWPVEANREI